tara:strand:- start:2828 stop:4768 length:1941 start_codon:yes stop_codon:yes gene_type:complete
MNKIFINIAAYRDPELIPTVRDAIEQAQNKKRLSFGVCWQHVKSEPESFGEDSDPLFDGVRVRYIRIPAEESRGMNWARKLAHGFWTKDCNFYLQIDSHMRFEKDWDLTLLKMVKTCDSKKPIITQRCFPYYPEQEGAPKKDMKGSTFMHGKKFRDNGVLVVSAGHVNTKKLKIKKPFPQAIVSGHFMFAHSDLIKEMPYDEDIAIIATGDEPLLGIKAWTRGWDMFSPHKPVLWHHFYREQSPKFHLDHKKTDEVPWRNLAEKGVRRSNQINFENYIGKYGLGKRRTLEEYGKYAGIDFKNRKVITEARIKSVFKGGKSSASVKTVKKSRDGGDEKIFVQIASYRDPDIEETIESMLSNSRRPDNLIVGVCDQYGPENKHLKYYNEENFRVIRVPFYASKGLGWARAQIQDLYFEGDAEYTMQLDSHMRFDKHWDKQLIDMIKETGSQKPIISQYCAGFSSKDIKDDEYLRKSKQKPFKMYCLRFNDTGTVSFRQTQITEAEAKTGKPVPSMLVSGHFYFTLAKHIREYKYDPNLYFAGDEISLATRSWTRGWDIFSPTKNVVFHNYTREKRICHWADQKVNYGSLHKESLKTLRKMLHREENDKRVGEYGLGEERSLEDFERISGIDFKNRELKDHAKNGVALF